MKRIGLVLVACVALAACGGGDVGNAAQTTTTKLTLLPTTTTTNVPSATEAPRDSALVQDTTTTFSASTTTTLTAPVNTTTALAETTISGDTAAQADPAVEALRLSDDGIGAAVFTGEPEGVIAYLTSFIGAPTGDTGWVDPFEISACSGSELRIVSWGALQLTFGDVSKVLQGRRHFFSYRYGLYSFDGGAAAQLDATPTGLLTVEHVGLGTPIIEVESAYRGLMLNPADDFVPPNFVVNDNFRGFVAGLADDSPVVQLIGGPSCETPT
ncbi:MAG: hypothetical protein ACI83Y_000775 [Candidatus Azotimanducaceae bacterium]|jgi:hypothetical protein